MGPEERELILLSRAMAKFLVSASFFKTYLSFISYFWAALGLHCGVWALRGGIWAFYSCGMQASLVMPHWFGCPVAHGILVP